MSHHFFRKMGKQHKMMLHIFKISVNNTLVGGGCDHLSKTCQGIIEIEVPIKGHSFVACFFSFTFCHKKCLQQSYLESQTQQIDVNAVPTQKHIHLLVYAKHNEPTVNMNVVGCI
mmetsp:Transcript_49010/g.74075  ORF Transcript_49010/g.74075 Transcript_49010/m.74075 type:complete len:115 (+) Transcript_49010:23-367(+)